MVWLAIQDEDRSRIVGCVDPSNVTSVPLAQTWNDFQHETFEFKGYDHPTICTPWQTTHNVDLSGPLPSMGTRSLWP